MTALFLGFLGSAISAGVNSLEARRQRNWQEDMRKHAYEVTMADMKRAGLNPILAYSQGATGAGSGAAARANISGGDGSSMLKAAKLSVEKRNLAAEVNLKNSSSAREVSQAALNKDLQGESNAKKELAVSQANMSEASATETRLRTEALNRTMTHRGTVEDFDKSPLGQILTKFGRGFEHIRGAAGTAIGAAALGKAK